MKKILTTLTMTAIFAMGNSFPDVGVLQPENKILKEDKKKSYKELIQFLSGSASGEYNMYLGIIYLNGIKVPDSQGETVPEDTEKAIKAFEKSIYLNYYKSAAVLGSLYLFDDRYKVLPNSLKKAKELLSLAVKHKIYEGTMALASYYFYSEKNSEKALELLHLGANNNISTAQLSLATIYAYGSEDLNISKDLFIGNKFLVQACTNKKQTEYVKKFCNSSFIKKGGK